MAKVGHMTDVKIDFLEIRHTVMIVKNVFLICVQQKLVTYAE